MNEKISILYFGTACNENVFEKNISNDSVKPSNSSVVFENAILKGFKQNSVNVEIYTFYPIASFPYSKHKTIKAYSEKIEDGLYTNIIGSSNLIWLKQITRAKKSKKIIDNWVKKTDGYKAILIYSIYYPIAKEIIKASQKYKIPCFAIVGDIPDYMFEYQERKGIRKVIINSYVKKIKSIEGRFDGYIYLTKYMAEKVGHKKPFTVVEGIADTEMFDKVTVDKEKEKFVLMYAGQLDKSYGIINLIEAFQKTNNLNYELWLYGSGDSIEYIKEQQKKDKRIKYYGRRPRREVLRNERKASLLVNVRPCNAEFTKYSFPSKTIEYMLSGTPLLSTELPGIPNEYYRYMYVLSNNSVDNIYQYIEKIYALGFETRNKMGDDARNFIIKNKNSKAQSGKILEFVKNTIKESVL